MAEDEERPEQMDRPMVTASLRPAPWLVGRAGWVAWLGDGEGDEPPVLVRLRMVDTGRLVVSALHLEDQARPLTSTRLRSVPLGRIEAAFSSGGVARQLVMNTLDDVEEGALEDLFERLDRFWRGMPAESGQGEGEVSQGVERALRRPGEQDSLLYYEEVAEQYRLRAARSRKPAALLAEEAGVPVGTVHRWIREARRLGFLPSGVKGKVG
jgi:hypothetical protein